MLTAGLDQSSKALATMSLDEGEVISIIDGFVDLRLRHNRGVAWGLGAVSPDPVRYVVFPMVSGVIGVALILYYRRLPLEETWRRIAVASVVGGGLGNLVDRVRTGAVTDFIGVRIGGAEWTMSGTFNLGDVWLIGGVALLVAVGRRSSMGDGGSP